jgi:hypothetical protein
VSGTKRQTTSQFFKFDEFDEGLRIDLRVEDLEFLVMPWLAREAEELYGEIAAKRAGRRSSLREGKKELRSR